MEVNTVLTVPVNSSFYGETRIEKSRHARNDNVIKNSVKFVLNVMMNLKEL